MNFLFVDRILECEPGKQVRGIKHVTRNDTYLQTLANGKIALFDCIVGETLGQLVAWHAIEQHDFRLRPVAGLVDEVIIHDHAYLGETIFLESFIDKLDEQAIEYHAHASVDGRPIFTISHALGPMVPMENFNIPESVQQQFKIINRPGEFVPSKEKQLMSTAQPTNFSSVSFDHILSWETGKQVVAEKNISVNAPYFTDHFPLKPVLPMSLLLHCNIQLGQEFLKDFFVDSDCANYRAIRIYKAKMKEFVLPGDTVQTTLTLKAQQEDKCILQFVSTVAGKRVCVAQADFIPEPLNLH